MSLSPAGTLSEIPVADLMLEIIRTQQSGILEVVSGKLKKQVAFSKGRPVAIQSNAMSESLFRLLESAKRLSAPDVAQLRVETKKSGKSLESLLVERKIVTADELPKLRTALSQLRLAGLYSWTEGTYRFRKQSVPSAEELPVPAAIMQMVRRKAEESNLLHALEPRRRERPRVVADPPFAPAGFGLSPEALEFCDGLDGDRELGEILAFSGLPPEDVALLIQAFTLGGMIEDTAKKIRLTPAAGIGSTGRQTRRSGSAPPQKTDPPTVPLAMPPSTGAQAVPLAPEGHSPQAPDRTKPASSSAAPVAVPLASPVTTEPSAPIAAEPTASSAAVPLAPPAAAVPLAPPAAAVPLAPPSSGADKAGLEARNAGHGVNGKKAAGAPRTPPGGTSAGASPEPTELSETAEPAPGEAGRYVLGRGAGADTEAREDPAAEQDALGLSIDAMIAEEIGEIDEASFIPVKLEHDPLLDINMSGFTPKERDTTNAFKEAYVRVHKQNYFEIFGLERRAKAADIRKAYFAMAKEYHTDRLVKLPEPIQKLGTEIFNIIQKAYDTLTEPESREKYVEATFYGKAHDEEAAIEEVQIVLQADQHFKTGIGLLNAGNLPGAHAAFSRARDLYPKEPEYNAAYGYTLFRLHHPKDEKKCEEAEKVIYDALRQNPKLDKADVYLGRIYLARGNVHQAAKYFVRALKINPTNLEAGKELRQLKVRREQQNTGLLSSFLGKFKK